MAYIWIFIKHFFIGIIVFFMLLPTLIRLPFVIIQSYWTINSKPKSTQE